MQIRYLKLKKEKKAISDCIQRTGHFQCKDALQTLLRLLYITNIGKQGNKFSVSIPVNNQFKEAECLDTSGSF